MEAPSHHSAISNLRAIIRESFEAFRPPADITISDWAIRNRVLPKGTTARPGPFHPEVFQVEMMDAILDPNVHEVTIQKSTQVGGTDAVMLNTIGYFIDADPKPIMYVLPTQDNAKDKGKKTITPMLDACPALRNKIRVATSRRPGNTLALKEFPGGFLKLTGANSGAGLRSDPVPVIIYDEVDAYPLDVDGEGDPQQLGKRRTDSFPDWKILRGSTPAKPKGISPIERDFQKSDQRRFYVPCPFCNHFQILYWRDPPKTEGDPPGEFRLVYEFDSDDQLIPGSVAYLCAGCKAKIPERYKQQMLNMGKWIAKFPGRETVGFHINALYSPWRDNWNDLAKEWHDANKENNPEALKAFINLRLGETWEEDSTAVESETLKKRREHYVKDVPAGVGILTASVDVQGDRLECVVKGWGDKEESWLIAWQQFFGDPGNAGGGEEDVWNQLDEFLQTKFEHVSGARVPIKTVMIDSGGQHTDEVYRFCRGRIARRIWACKGSSEAGKEICGKFTQNNQYRVRLWSLGTDTAKDRIFARLKLAAPGAGYMHLPDWIEEEYLLQLTAEKAVRRYKKNRGAVREYVKTRGRNEALDLEVYALAALYSLGQQVLRELKGRAELLNAGNAGEIVPDARSSRGVRHPGVS